MHVAVLGPGGVGGFVAAALWRAGAEVTVVAREETAAAIERDGIVVRSARLGDFTARPPAAAALDSPADVLVVATKATGLDEALDRVRADAQLVVPLLNGLDHVSALRDRFGTRAVAAAIRIESDRPAPGRIVQTSPFLRVDLASADAGMREPVERFAAALEAAEIPARVLDSEAQALWDKLVRLNALALTTSAWDLLLGEIRSDPGRRAQLEACVSEGAAVARAEGADVEPGRVMGDLDDAHATLGSSMQRDIAAGREPELDAIAGSVLRAAARHGLACPTVERLAGEVARRAGAPAPVL